MVKTLSAERPNARGADDEDNEETDRSDFRSCIDGFNAHSDFESHLGPIQELLDQSRHAMAAAPFHGGREVDEEADGISIKHLKEPDRPFTFGPIRKKNGVPPLCELVA